MALKIFPKRHRNQACHSTYNRKKPKKPHDDNDSAVLVLVESQYSSVHVIVSSAVESVWVPLKLGCAYVSKWEWRLGRRPLACTGSGGLSEIKGTEVSSQWSCLHAPQGVICWDQKKGKFLFLQKLALISRVRLQTSIEDLVSWSEKKTKTMQQREDFQIKSQSMWTTFGKVWVETGRWLKTNALNGSILSGTLSESHRERTHDILAAREKACKTKSTLSRSHTINTSTERSNSEDLSVVQARGQKKNKPNQSSSDANQP